MTDADSSKFKIRLDDESPDSQFQEEIEDKKLEKLSRKITLFSIFFPCLIGLILAVAYFNIHKRVVSLQNTGVSNVQSLSKDLESRFASVSAKQAQLEESFTKTISALQAELKEATTAIKHIRSARTIDNNKFKGELTKLDETLTAVVKNLETVSAGIKNIESGFKQELTRLAETIDNEKNKIDKLQADISALSSAKIDKKALDLALLNQQKKYQQELTKTIKSLEDKIESLRKTTEGVQSPKKQTATIKQETIIEEEIKE